MVLKTIRVSILIGLFLFSLMHLQVSAEQDHWWNDSWSYRQEIILNSITTKEFAHYQPVDITIQFDTRCWAINETKHSVRVIFQNNNEDLELESQIYNLVYSDETHITSCNLVFLIPSQADGTEQYFVYYDDSQTSSFEYPDYVSIEDSSYFYEPIPGYPLESHFYKIFQNGSIRYIVAQEGKFLWYTTAQCVTKLKEGSTEVMPKNGVAIASFEFVYYYGEEMSQYFSTSQELQSKEILCDGNLMVSCKIISGSTGENLRTTAIYKYFYCPTSIERIQVHVVHEALKDCSVYIDANTDGTYASLQCGGIKSASITDLNFGKIYPYYHFYSEHDTIEGYQVDLHPEYSQEDPVVRLIQTTDDVDIGKNAWVAFDEGTNGTVHALVFGSSSLVKAGVDERDGMQLKVYESNYPHLPGLDYMIAALECTRNSYEENVSGKDIVIPKGFIAEYDAEFFSSPIGGYPLVEREANIFQTLVPMKPSIRDNLSPEKNKSADRFSLMVYIHDAPSFPLGSALSAITGRFFPYINIEVYRDNELVCSGTAGRLPFKEFVLSEESSFRAMISAAIHSIDIHNISLFKRFLFKQLEAGRYLIKVFRENPRLGNERYFIGYMIVDLTKDSQIHIFCTLQSRCLVTVVDQQGNGIYDVNVMLVQDDIVIDQNRTNIDGSVILVTPSGWRETYQLKILYHGFEVINESIKLKYKQVLVPLKKSLELERYDWSLTLIDLWGLPLEINVIPRLTSTAMQIPTIILSKQNNHNTYQFADLIPETYQLRIQYKSFVVEKEIQIPSNDESVIFPASFPVSFRVFDSRGIALEGMTIQLSRGGITKETTSNDSAVIFSLPPGLYLVKVLSQGNIIGQRSLSVMGGRGVELITNLEPIYPLVFISLICIIILIGIAFGLIKKQPLYILLTLAVGISIIALQFPWWLLQGSSADINTSSTLYLIPLNLVSMTTTSQVITGELTFFPEIFTTIMMLIPIITVIVGLLVFLILVLTWISKKVWQNILLIGVIILLLSSLSLFISAMSAFTEVGVGSFIGQGTLDISIPGEEKTVPILCQWGPGIGFWLYITSSLILVCAFIVNRYKKIEKK